MSTNTTKLSIDMAKLQSDVAHIKENLDAHIQKEDEHMEAFRTIIKEFMDAADTRYSGKWLEQFIVKVGWSIAAVLIPSGLYFLYSLILHINK